MPVDSSETLKCWQATLKWRGQETTRAILASSKAQAEKFAERINRREFSGRARVIEIKEVHE